MSFQSQDEQIEVLLRSRYGVWVACYELADLALQYCRAIHSIRTRLRQAGDTERIENTTKRVSGKVHGSYRIRRTADILAERNPAPANPLRSTSSDWYTQATGQKRAPFLPASIPSPDLGPLFGASSL